jgi:RimJ/RimL family protein N-acetyltransferase
VVPVALRRCATIPRRWDAPLTRSGDTAAMPDAVPLPAPDLAQLASLSSPFATDRLWVAPVAEAQAAAMYAWLCDPQVYEWIGLLPPPDLPTLQARYARTTVCSSWPARELLLAWSVQRRSDGAWIGSLDANLLLAGVPDDGAPGLPAVPSGSAGVASNVGYFFGQPYWGSGLATEAVRGLCAHLDAHGITEQHATVTVGNHASCRVLERCGFRRTGVLTDNDTLRGVLVDDIAFIRQAASVSS